MKQTLTRIIFTAAVALTAIVAGTPAMAADKGDETPLIRRKTIESPDSAMLAQKVIVRGDTVPMIIPQRNLGRFDRGLYNYLFIPRREWAVGLTASYGEFDASDVQVLSLLKDLDFKGYLWSVNPSVSYFFANNQSIGVKFNYQRGQLDLGGMTLDIDDDMNFTLSDVSYYTRSTGASIFYRNYIGLGTMKRFAIFNEVDLSVNSGESRFQRQYNGELRDTRTTTTGAALNFSPGLTMFIMDRVSFNVSFGVFGVKLQQEKQRTNNVDEGSRFSSGANFKFNLFNIKFGIGVHI
ncbi:MAG: hypothetical protein J1E63_01950 [Muribaculaceae bacterium]|nr:hypothetical protein [Muribaculaceae bacterium]